MHVLVNKCILLLNYYGYSSSCGWIKTSSYEDFYLNFEKQIQKQNNFKKGERIHALQVYFCNVNELNLQNLFKFKTFLYYHNYYLFQINVNWLKMSNKKFKCKN